MKSRRVAVGISGATGAIYGIRTLEILKAVADVEVHLVISKAAKRTIPEETDYKVRDVTSLANDVYDDRDIGAALASGSFRTEGMIIAPCSVKTVAAIANAYSDTLISRAADVTLKERRRLVLLVRETPLHAAHLRVMAEADRAGAILLPPVPAFYNRPKTLDDIVNHTVARALTLLGLESGIVEEWRGTARARDGPTTLPRLEEPDPRK